MRSLAVLIASVGFLVAALVGARSLMFFMTSASTKGTVVEYVPIDSQHYFEMRYEVGGETHEVRSHRYPGRHSENTGMHVSQIVTVRQGRPGRAQNFSGGSGDSESGFTRSKLWPSREHRSETRRVSRAS